MDRGFCGLSSVQGVRPERSPDRWSAETQASSLNVLVKAHDTSQILCICRGGLCSCCLLPLLTPQTGIGWAFVVPNIDMSDSAEGRIRGFPAGEGFHHDTFALLGLDSTACCSQAESHGRRNESQTQKITCMGGHGQAKKQSCLPRRDERPGAGQSEPARRDDLHLPYMRIATAGFRAEGVCLLRHPV